MSPVAVIGFEIEAREYMVCSVAGIRRSRSAHPNPSSHTTSPPRATATAMEGASQATSALRISSRTDEKSGAATPRPEAVWAWTPVAASRKTPNQSDADGRHADGRTAGGRLPVLLAVPFMRLPS